jgi:hypothetical protein
MKAITLCAFNFKIKAMPMKAMLMKAMLIKAMLIRVISLPLVSHEIAIVTRIFHT